MDQYINIVAFNIPWPPNYGGVIDVYYKMKALREQGVKILLHCFEYERPHAAELESVCEKVYYYKRRTGLLANMTVLPYNVYSRKDPELLARLLENDYPILFDGLHCCYYLNDPRLKKRKKIYREANIEHDYYRHLAKAETSWIKKCFFEVEAARFERFQPVLSHTDLMVVVSTTDRDYLQRIFPDKRVEYMPCYHGNDGVTIRPGISDFILYHGKLSVTENTKAALYLIRHVFCKLNYPCIIAGMNPPDSLREAAAPYPHICIEANPSAERMEWLIREAQIHLLITFQATGLKLKLLNSLFAGRHTVVNREMVTGSGLDALCHIADTPDKMVETCTVLMKKPFTESLITERIDQLYPSFSNRYQGERLYKMIYEEA